MHTKLCPVLGALAVIGLAHIAGPAQASPITTDIFPSSDPTANTIDYQADYDPIAINGMTFAGGFSLGAYFLNGYDFDYLNEDTDGEATTLTLSFASPANGFGFDYLTGKSSITVSAYSASNVLLETDMFTGSLFNEDDYRGTSGYAGMTGLSDVAYIVVSASKDGSFYIGTVTEDLPVPEPASIAMLGFGLCMLGIARRRLS